MANFSYAYASNHDECNLFSEKYFQINNCGALRVINKKGGLSLRNPRLDYMLLYLYDGNGWCDIKGTRMKMRPGDMMFLKPGEPLHFGFEYNSMHFWMHFTGSAVDDMFGECGITETAIYHIGVRKDVWESLTDIYLHHSFNTKGGHLRAKGAFFELLGYFAEKFNPGENAFQGTRERKIYPALKDMKLNYDRKRKVEYYAELCGLTLSDFQHSFSKITGTTPQKYVTSLRIDVAKKLLISSKVSVKEIAFTVGYDDPLYFSRIFKKITGMSPKEYADTESRKSD